MAKPKVSGAKAFLRKPSINNFSNLSIKDLRSKVREYAFKKFAGLIVKNKSNGFDIKIPKKGIKEATSKQRQIHEIKAVKRLPSMIERAKYIGSEPDKKNNPGVKQYHIFETTASVDKKKYSFVIKIRELQDGKYFYDSYTKK